jgi:hypothetical protein
MCANCISTAEMYAAQVALAGAILQRPVHRLLASAGLVEKFDPVARDARTVAFLRGLQLEPAAILGADAVAAADQWVPQSTAPVRWRRPIGSQSRLATQ